MKDVFIGSEGSLGIITKVLLQLVPKPRARGFDPANGHLP
jgi:glycolate oxidase